MTLLSTQVYLKDHVEKSVFKGLDLNHEFSVYKIKKSCFLNETDYAIQIMIKVYIVLHLYDVTSFSTCLVNRFLFNL